MAKNSTYNFQNLSLDIIIEEAYERIGIPGEKLVPNLLSSAARSINLILIEWMSKTTNLWTLETSFLPLVQNQSTYALDNTVNDLVQCLLRNSTRVLGGVASSSSGGVANNAFDGNLNTSCAQTAINGSIFYTYSLAQTITFVGIASAVTRDYSLEIRTQNNGVDNLLLAIPAQTFLAKTPLWFNVPAPKLGTVYYIKETGGATLNIAEIYFNNNVVDTLLSNVSRYNYYNYPQKALSGRPSVYYLDKQGSPFVPTLSIWPTPSVYYSNAVLFYTYKKMIADAGSYLNSPAIPALLYPALIAELAYRLSVKYKPELAGNLKLDAENAFFLASSEDSESTAIKITPSWKN